MSVNSSPPVNLHVPLSVTSIKVKVADTLNTQSVRLRTSDSNILEGTQI